MSRAKYQQHPSETWDAARCEKEANHTASDGLGTPYPFKGYIGSHYGKHRYNGGVIRDGEYYDGEIVPLPEVDDAYEIIHVPTWGYRIVKKDSK